MLQGYYQKLRDGELMVIQARIASSYAWVAAITWSLCSILGIRAKFKPANFVPSGAELILGGDVEWDPAVSIHYTCSSDRAIRVALQLPNLPNSLVACMSRCHIKSAIRCAKVV